MTPEQTVARCVGVRKVYRTETALVEALRGVDAEFRSAGVTAVVGRSGSGKSTLLRLLAAIDRPTGGTISVRERELTALRARELRAVRRSLVGYVFQRPSDNFIPYLTLAEHLELASGGHPRDFEQLLDLLALSGRRHHYPHELSGGEQQRAAFAQVVVAGARLVVADEPTAELDAKASADVLGVVSRLAQGGVAFVVATHDLHVLRVADASIELEDGRVKPRSTRRPTRAEQPQRPKGRPGAELLLDVVGVSKRFRRGPETIQALKDVTLRLHAGELVALVGRSGSGKTTLLNVIAGFENPDEGAVAWRDKAPSDPRFPSWRQVAVLPQKFGLLEELTVRENVEYPARLANVLPEIKDWIDELTATLALDDLPDRLPFETSIGQQQRAALCRALVLRPSLVLADEPTGHQDARSAEAVLRAIRLAAQAGTACVVATHNADLAAELTTAYLMTDGRLDRA